MRLRNKFFIAILLAIIVIFFTASIIVSFYGKNLVTALLEQNLQKKTSLGGIRLEFPFRFSLEKLEVVGLFKAERISFSPNIAGFLAGKIVLGGFSITDPVVNLIQYPDGSLNLPKFKQGAKPPSLFLTGIKVSNGKLNFLDQKINPEGFLTRVEDINVDISQVIFAPMPLDTKFKLSARIADQNEKQLGDLNASGWVNFFLKNMDATLELRDLEATYFSPYYGDFISKKKLLSAKLNFVSQLKAENNDLEIASSLKLSHLVYAPQEPVQESEVPSLEFAKNALDLFTDKEGNLNLDFSLKTKLDNPEISIEQLKKAILNAALNNLASQNPQELIEKVSNTVQKFKDFGQQMEKIFKNKE